MNNAGDKLKKFTKIYKFAELTLKNYIQRIIFKIELPKPFTTVYINPSIIKFTNNYGGTYKSCLIKNGNWDLEVNLFKNSDRYKFISKRIINKLEWADTGAIDMITAEVLKKPGYDGLFNSTDVIKRYEKLDQLILHLRNGGEFFDETKYKRKPYEHDSPMINIDRNGELLLCSGGHHRVAIAMCLKIEKIPVTLGTIHHLAVIENFWKKNIQLNR